MRKHKSLPTPSIQSSYRTTYDIQQSAYLFLSSKEKLCPTMKHMLQQLVQDAGKISLKGLSVYSLQKH